MHALIDSLLTTDAGLVVLLVGTPALIVAWTLVVARLTRYSARDHDRAYLAHHRRAERGR
jgi:hypothetical protein